MPGRFITVLALIILIPSEGGSYESDQFSNRHQDIADASSVMNKQVTLAIANSITGLYGPEDHMEVVDRIYHKIGGVHWVDKLERWTMDSDQVERLSTPPYESIYRGHPLWATRVAALFGVGATININGVLIGSDKLGHFLSQGRKFYRRWLKMNDEAKAAEHSAYTERALFGQMTTGSYSNADLVANYEGYRFYRSLFEDDIVNGKPAILSRVDDYWIMHRPLDWADHVNDYWDEALNINHYDKLLYPHMKNRLLILCDDYFADPDLFVVHNEASLKQQYRHLQLRETSELRLSNLCVEESQDAIETASSAPGLP